MQAIVHLLGADEWEVARAQGALRPASLETEGFAHCSAPEQAVEVANRYFRGRTDLMVVVLDAERISSPVRWEPPSHLDGLTTVPDEPWYPHVYGPIELTAVLEVHPWMPRPDGSFDALP